MDRRVDVETYKNNGWLDDEELFADAVGNDGSDSRIICVSGELVTLVQPDDGSGKSVKVFSDTVDRLADIKVKSGLFKKSLAFTYNGTAYAFRINASKKFIEYFRLLTDNCE